MNSSNLVYIIILNWNGWQDTIECVESCRKLSYPNFRILIVDNGSTDGSEAILREHFPHIEFIQTGANLGFAGGNNVGIHYALEQGANYVWLLNNDTITDTEALTELMNVVNCGGSVGIVGSKIYYYSQPRKIWFAGGFWRQNKAYTSIRGAEEEDSGQYDQICEVDFITGCSLLIKSKVIEQIGMMKEDYFLYWEEVDWNTAAYQQGWKIVLAPKSVVWHKVSASLKKQTVLQIRYYIRNCLLFFQRHERRRLFPLIAYILFDSFQYYKKGDIEPAKAHLLGVLDYALRRFGRIA